MCDDLIVCDKATLIAYIKDIANTAHSFGWRDESTTSYGFKALIGSIENIPLLEYKGE